jgi:parvulin-like peptidyl-prolyl isomerase
MIRARMLRCPVVALLAMAVGLGCRAGRPDDPVVLALGKQEVLRSEFERQSRALEARDGPLAEPVRRALLDSFLEERVLVLEARERGLATAEASPEDEQLAVQQLLAERVFGGLQVGDGEIASYYQAHAPDLRVKDAVTLRQILVPTENEARDVRRRLLRDPRSFEALARSLSHAPEASTGGMMGSFTRGQLPAEMEEAAFALAAGALSEILHTPLGYHVLKVESRRPARDRTLEECREEIAALLLREKRDRGVKEFVRELLARAKVNHEAALAPART